MHEISIAMDKWLGWTVDQHHVLERRTGLELITQQQQAVRRSNQNPYVAVAQDVADLRRRECG